MTNKAVYAALAVFAGSAISLSPLAAETDAASGYAALVGVIASDEMKMATFERDMEEGFIAVFKQDEEIVELEQECPGFIDGMAAELRPLMLESHEEDYAWYRGELGKLFRGSLSDGEAQSAATFFASDIGQKFLMTAVSQGSAEHTISDIMENDDMSVSKSALERDKAATARRTIEALDPEVLTAFVTQMSQAEWYPALMKMQPRLNALNLEMANRETSAEFDAELEARAEGFTEKHFDACYGEE